MSTINIQFYSVIFPNIYCFKECMDQKPTIKGQIHTHMHTYTHTHQGKSTRNKYHINMVHLPSSLKNLELLFGAYNRNTEFNQELFKLIK